MINIDTRLLPKVNENEMWFLLHLTKRINSKEKICWPSNARLCADTGWNIEKVQRVKKALIGKGMIEVVMRPDKTNIYKLCTSMLSVFIQLENVEFEEIEPDGFSGTHGNSGIGRGVKSGSKVLANEVLVNNVSSNDDTPEIAFDTEPRKEVHTELPSKAKTKKKGGAEKNLIYASCVEFWLKEFHPGWTFGAIHGKAMKSLINKIRASSQDGTDPTLIATFKKMCQSLPEWFKGKDLPVLDSKFNEIITQIQQGRQIGGYHQQNSAERYFSDYGK